jgi:signal transduction histidine kinase
MMTFRSILNTGIVENQHPFERVTAYTLNTFVAVSFAISTFLVAYNIAVGYFYSAIITFLFPPLLAPVLLLNKHQKIRIAAIYYILLGCSAVVMATYFSYQAGRLTDIENFLFIFAVAATFLLVGYDRIVIFLFCGGLLISSKYLRVGYQGETDLTTVISTMINNILVLTSIYGTGYIFSTSLRKSMSKLEEQRIKLQKSDDNKSEVFRILAHDIKGPINSIWQFLDMTNTSDLTKKDLVYFLNAFAQQLYNTKNGVENLLTWSADQMKGMSCNPVQVDLDKTISNIEKYLKSTLDKKQIRLIRRLDIQTVDFDIDHIEIVLRNYISNAIKFSEEGSIIEVAAFDKDNGHLIQISDSGAGIDSRKLQKINQGEFVGSSHGTEGELGSGLGLSFCYELVKINNANVTVDSEVGKGTTVSIALTSSS